jgi:membrane protease YdiL (CAAX protease family)
MTEEQPIPPPPPPAAEAERFPFWGYADVFLVAGLALPCMFLGWAIARLTLWIFRLHTAGQAEQAVAQMVIGYILLFALLKVIFRVQYDRPFWRSLGWTETRLPVVWCVVCGFGTSLLVALVAVAIRNPPITGPLIDMMKDRTALILLALFGTTAAPLFEELAFRGFVQPLLVRSLGAIAGIGISAALFGALHFSEYGDSWRPALLIGVSGLAFGCIRHFTGSTKAAVIAHAVFNGLTFLTLFTQGKSVLH